MKLRWFVDFHSTPASSPPLLLLLLMPDRSSPECFDVGWTHLSPEQFLSDVV